MYLAYIQECREWKTLAPCWSFPWHIHSHPLPYSSHLDLLLSLHVLWSRTNTCYMFCEQLEARNQQWIHFFFPGVWDIHWIWGWEDIDWVLSKHRTIETIKLVISLLLLIPPAFWWNLGKLTAGWIRTVIKHDVNCWALNLYPSSI